MLWIKRRGEGGRNWNMDFGSHKSERGPIPSANFRKDRSRKRFDHAFEKRETQRYWFAKGSQQNEFMKSGQEYRSNHAEGPQVIWHSRRSSRFLLRSLWMFVCEVSELRGKGCFWCLLSNVEASFKRKTGLKPKTPPQNIPKSSDFGQFFGSCRNFRQWKGEVLEIIPPQFYFIPTFFHITGSLSLFSTELRHIFEPLLYAHVRDDEECDEMW